MKCLMVLFISGLSSDALGALVSLPIFLLAAVIIAVIVRFLRRKHEEQPGKSETGIEIGIQTSFKKSSNKAVITESFALEATTKDKSLGNKWSTDLQSETSFLELKVPTDSKYRRANNYVTFPIINDLLIENTKQIFDSGKHIKLPQTTTNDSTVSTIVMDDHGGTLC